MNQVNLSYEAAEEHFLIFHSQVDLAQVLIELSELKVGNPWNEAVENSPPIAKRRR